MEAVSPAARRLPAKYEALETSILSLFVTAPALLFLG